MPCALRPIWSVICHRSPVIASGIDPSHRPFPAFISLKFLINFSIRPILQRPASRGQREKEQLSILDTDSSHCQATSLGPRPLWNGLKISGGIPPRAIIVRHFCVHIKRVQKRKKNVLSKKSPSLSIKSTISVISLIFPGPLIGSRNP